MRIIKSLCLSFLCIFSVTAYADNSVAVDFVKSFYIDLQKAEADTSLGRIQKLKDYFEPGLYQLLVNDDDNRAKNKDHMCGFVAFDVFGNFREDVNANVKAELVPSDTSTQVAVTLPDTKTPALTMQLKNEKGKWKISNIVYPTDTMGPDGLIGKLQQTQKVNCPKEVEAEE